MPSFSSGFYKEDDEHTDERGDGKDYKCGAVAAVFSRYRRRKWGRKLPRLVKRFIYP